jgi:hypothetical protein
MARTARVAFLALVHKAPRYVERIARLLARDGDEIFIHVDSSVEISPFHERLSSLAGSAHLIADRYAIAWGGFGMVRATNALIDAATQSGEFDYFYLLSGQCFPIRPMRWLKEVLKQGNDFIQCELMPTQEKPLSRLRRRTVNVPIRGLRYRGKLAAEKLLNLAPVTDFEKKFRLRPHAGSQWWCLTRRTLQYVREYCRTHPQYDRYMKWTHCPDEMYYHTLVANGPDRTKISNSLTGTIWGPAKHPEIISRSNLPIVLDQNTFLARKFEVEDSAFLDEIESDILQNEARHGRRRIDITERFPDTSVGAPSD